MKESLELITPAMNRYVELNVALMRQHLDVVEVVSNGFFAVCKIIWGGGDATWADDEDLG